VIYWKDFILDENFGPILEVPGPEIVLTSCRVSRLGRPKNQDDSNGEIQETGQEQRPARMVGLSSLDSQKSAESHMDVDRSDRQELMRRRGES